MTPRLTCAGATEVERVDGREVPGQAQANGWRNTRTRGHTRDERVGGDG
ncbi:hypothetical protein WME91_09470 [Sorangium sp. So ce269]